MKLTDKDRLKLYTAMLEGINLLIENTKPNSELASLIMAREHVIDALSKVEERANLH